MFWKPQQDSQNDQQHRRHSDSGFTLLRTPYTGERPRPDDYVRRGTALFEHLRTLLPPGRTHLPPQPSPGRVEAQAVSNTLPHIGSQTYVKEHSQLTVILRDFIKQHRTLSRMRDKVLQTRSHLDFEEQSLAHTKGFVNESMQDFMQSQRDMMVQRTFEARHQQLCELYDQCQNYQATFEAQKKVTDRIKHELNNLEYRLLQEDQDFMMASTSVVQSFGVDPAALYMSESQATVSEISSSEVDPLLQRYYDRKGDAGVRLERLQDLNYSHQEEAREREFIADRGDPLELSEDDFLADYVTQRQQIIAEFEEAEADAERLAQECKIAGIDIESRRPPTFDGLGQPTFFPAAEIFDLQQQTEPPVAPPSRGLLYESLPSSQKARRTSRSGHQNVRSWLDSLESDPAIHSPVSEQGTVLERPVCQTVDPRSKHLLGHHRRICRSCSLPRIGSEPSRRAWTAKAASEPELHSWSM